MVDIMTYKNPILDLANRHPVIMSVLGFALFFELPARLVGMSYRQAKHGNYKLGNDLAGMPAGRAYAPAPDEGIYKGDLYRDTTHMNRYAASGPGGRSIGNDGGDPLYRDTRYLTPTKPTPNAYDSAFFSKKNTAADRTKHVGKIAGDSPQSLVNMHTGNSVFAGLSGVNKLWGGYK